jgi:hypothetical protein
LFAKPPNGERHLLATIRQLRRPQPCHGGESGGRSVRPKRGSTTETPVDAICIHVTHDTMITAWPLIDCKGTITAIRYLADWNSIVVTHILAGSPV